MAAGVALPLQAASAAASAGAAKLTNGKMLQSMDFAPNASNVHMDQNASRAAASESTAQPGTTGTTGVDYNEISAKEFISRRDAAGTQWRDRGRPNCCVDLSRISSETLADAQFEVPTGAHLDFFRYWAFDENAANLAFFVFEVCQPEFAAGAPVIMTIVSTSTSGAPGNTTGFVTLNRPVNNQDCTYLARVRFDAASTKLALQKVRLQFTRWRIVLKGRRNRGERKQRVATPMFSEERGIATDEECFRSPSLLPLP